MKVTLGTDVTKKKVRETLWLCQTETFQVLVLPEGNSGKNKLTEK